MNAIPVKTGLVDCLSSAILPKQAIQGETPSGKLTMILRKPVGENPTGFFYGKKKTQFNVRVNANK